MGIKIMKAYSLDFKAKPIVGLMGLMYSVLFIYLLFKPIKADPNIVLALGIIPFSIKINQNNYSFRYFIWAGISFFVALFIPVNSLIIIFLLFSILFLIESQYGKLDELILGLILFISPIFKNLSHLFEYSLRITLSEGVTKLFQMMGFISFSKGNTIILSGKEFSVDPACSGLNMLETSFLLSLFLVGFYQRKAGKKLPLWVLGGIILCTVFLNMGSNFMRILVLIISNIPPNNPAHEGIGLICLFIYGLIPMKFFIEWIIPKMGKTYTLKRNVLKFNPQLLSASLLIGIFFLIHIRKGPDEYLQNIPSTMEIKGYKKSKLSQGLVKFENPEALIYLKSTNFYAPDHDPMICWRGSGYEFQMIEKLRYNGRPIMFGILKKGNDLLYSAWWFDDGKVKTIDQWDWRYRAATQTHPFYLINITTQNPENLKKNLQILLKTKLF